MYKSSLTNHNAEVYQANASFVYSDAFTAPVLQLLNAQPGERILDLGCGSGELTAKLALLVGEEGSILGVDSAQDMLDKAAVATQRSPNVTYLPPFDIQAPTYPEGVDAAAVEGSFDAVFSNAVLHWCKRDPVQALKTAAKFLKPGGRIALEMGGQYCLIGIRGALHAALKRRGINPDPLDPFFFPTIDEYRTVVEAAGLVPVSLTHHYRPTPLPAAGLYGWLQTFTENSFLSTLPSELKHEIMREVVEECKIDACKTVKQDDGMEVDKWEVLYTRLRVVATKPE